jgi:tetraacyldisaccharide 4'-kinase
VVLTGIAHPKPLINHLEKTYNIVGHHEFPDHHPFTEKEIQAVYDQHFNNIGNQCVLVTTEKDWMRLQSEHIRNIVSLLPVFVIRVEVEFLTENQRDSFNQIVKDHVRGKKKENS